MDEREVSREPTVAQTSAAGWRAWVTALLEYGREQIVGLGLTLVLGFLLGLGALYSFAALAEDVAHNETMDVDNAVLMWLRQFSSPDVDRIAQAVSFLGSEGLAAILVVLVLVFAWRRRLGAAVGLLVVTGGAQLLNDVLKELFHRTRPAPVGGSLIPSQAFSFPSGHAMVSAAFYFFLAYLAWRLLRGRGRYVTAALLVVLVALIGLSRLYLGVHYFSDVVAGYLAGFFWTDATIVGGRVLRMRRLPRETTAGAGRAPTRAPPARRARGRASPRTGS